jgi:1,4-alpha-glucan branching enzyme
MIKRTTEKSGKVKVTFVLPYEEGQQIVVVGDFNNWDPTANKLAKRNNGTCSASVTLDQGQRYLFRYYLDSGSWFNDDAADGYEANEHGTENGVLLT